jgi:hypothetical protein
MENLALKMQQEAKTHWRYEWPLKRKVKMARSETVGQRTAKTVEKVAEVC